MSRNNRKYFVEFTIGDTDYSMEFNNQKHAVSLFRSLEKGEIKSASLKEERDIMSFLKIGEAINLKTENDTQSE